MAMFPFNHEACSNNIPALAHVSNFQIPSPTYFTKPYVRHVPEARYMKLKTTSRYCLVKLIQAQDSAAGKHVAAVLHGKQRSISRRGQLQSVNVMCLGKMQQDGLVFEQDFCIRSYELGPDSNVTIKAIMNFLQEATINQAKALGLQNDGFGCSSVMCERSLIWVVRNLNIFIHRYPIGDDVIRVRKWYSPAEQYGICHYWLVQDLKTGETVIKAYSKHVMMNKITRKLSKIPDEAKAELEAHSWDYNPINSTTGTISNSLRRLNAEEAEHVVEGLTPVWSDFDCNQHVSHIKYIDWILMSMPNSVFESYTLSAIAMDFRGEYSIEDNSRVVSLSSTTRGSRDIPQVLEAEFVHSIVFQNGSEIVRAKTTWTPRMV